MNTWSWTIQTAAYLRGSSVWERLPWQCWYVWRLYCAIYHF